MYHFVSEKTPELRLSENVLVSSHTTQYLKGFQVDAIRFCYDKLSKHELAILNDESGLGKCAVVAGLLNSLGANKKTLIVMQNDDQILLGWKFHFGVLTELPVCVIQGIDDNTNSAHRIYLAKWSVLRSIGDLSKLKFDYVIVDHRGYTLNNHFCTSMLLKQFEGKVNVVISSVDLTSDVKLLYNVLRLGGHLEHQFKDFMSFNQKFQLPEPKEVFSKRVDLEEYYKKRGILGEYVKNYRIRRYRHQFDHHLPLVTLEQYKTNLSLWLASGNNSNSTISETTIESTTVESDEIINCFRNIKREQEQQFRSQEDSEKLSEHSDDVILMSPLIFESDEDEGQQHHHPVKPLTMMILSSDECELITPPKTPQQKSRQNCNAKSRSAETKPHETNGMTPSRKTRSASSAQVSTKTRRLNVKVNRLKLDITEKLLKSEPSEKKPPTRLKKLETNQKTSPDSERRETRSMQRLTRAVDARIRTKYMSTPVSLEEESKRKKRKLNGNQTPTTSRKKEGRDSKILKPNNENHPTPKLRKNNENTTRKTSSATKLPNSVKKGKPKEVMKTKTTTTSVPPTPQLISSGSTVSGYMESLQCAQRLPENLNELDVLDVPAFRIPYTPQSVPVLNLLSDSEVVSVPINTQRDVIIISSSHDESSQQSWTHSRRTRALKRRPKKPSKLSIGSNEVQTSQPPPPNISNFGVLQRPQTKSPDIFSNCSDISQLVLAQPVAAPPCFEGFKIFGSEVKQTAKQSVAATKKRRDRSCLDILEQMFEPRDKTKNDKQNGEAIPADKRTVTPTQHCLSSTERRSLIEDDIFEITNNGEFGSRLRLNSTGDVSPVQQTQLRGTQHNKITNYLIGSNATQDDELMPTNGRNRKSPKSLKSTPQQSTKLTRWFGTGAGTTAKTTNLSGESVNSSPIMATSNDRCQTPRNGRVNGPTKRKRLELYK